MSDEPRRERAKWKTALQWAVGGITDPHTKWSSAARIVGITTAFALDAYVLTCPFLHEKPDPWVVSTMSSIIIAALALRSRSTQEGRIPLAIRHNGTAPGLSPLTPDPGSPQPPIEAQNGS